MLAEWAAVCAEHVLPLFEEEQPDDTRPRDAIEVGRGWIRGEVPMRVAQSNRVRGERCRTWTTRPGEVRRPRGRASRRVAHVAAHDLGAAAYAIRAAAASPASRSQHASANETGNEKESPPNLRDLVLDDQHQRSPICWNTFDD